MRICPVCPVMEIIVPVDVTDVEQEAATGPAGTVTPAAAVGNATSVDDIVEDFNALLANLRDAGLLER